MDIQFYVTISSFEIITQKLKKISSYSWHVLCIGHVDLLSYLRYVVIVILVNEKLCLCVTDSDTEMHREEEFPEVKVSFQVKSLTRPYLRFISTFQ